MNSLMSGVQQARQIFGDNFFNSLDELFKVSTRQPMLPHGMLCNYFAGHSCMVFSFSHCVDISLLCIKRCTFSTYSCQFKGQGP